MSLGHLSVCLFIRVTFKFHSGTEQKLNKNISDIPFWWEKKNFLKANALTLQEYRLKDQEWYLCQEGVAEGIKCVIWTIYIHCVGKVVGTNPK